MAIDPSARIAPGVELAPDVEVGPGVIIDGPSSIGAGTRILAHAYIGPYTTIGAAQPHRLRGHRRLRPPGLRLHRGGELHHHRRPQPDPGVRHHPPGHQARQRHPGGQPQFSHGLEPHGPQLLAWAITWWWSTAPWWAATSRWRTGPLFRPTVSCTSSSGWAPWPSCGAAPGPPGTSRLTPSSTTPTRSRGSIWWG